MFIDFTRNVGERTPQQKLDNTKRFLELKQKQSCLSIRDDPYGTSRKNTLELIELSSIKLV